jgi:hypothetical protein
MSLMGNASAQDLFDRVKVERARREEGQGMQTTDPIARMFSLKNKENLGSYLKGMIFLAPAHRET